jgi:hypothetical protein
MACHKRDIHTIVKATNTVDADPNYLSDNTRLIHAWMIVRGIPNPKAQKVSDNLLRGTTIGGDPEADEDRPRIYNLDVDALIAEYPAWETQINKLFDPTKIIPQANLPDITYAKFLNTIWDKINLRIATQVELEA